MAISGASAVSKWIAGYPLLMRRRGTTVPGSGKLGFGKSGADVDVAALMDGLGWQGVRELVEAGALVGIALTSDGGALGVTVTVDGEWERDYFRDRDELLAWFAQAIPVVQELKGSRRPSSAPDSGSRRRKRS